MSDECRAEAFALSLNVSLTFNEGVLTVTWCDEEIVSESTQGSYQCGVHELVLFVFDIEKLLQYLVKSELRSMSRNAAAGDYLRPFPEPKEAFFPVQHFRSPCEGQVLSTSL